MGIFHRTDEPHGGAGHTTVVAPGTKIEGRVKSAGGLHIDGEIEGDAVAKTYAIVAEHAVVRGEVHAREVYLGGRVTGDIWALEVEIFGEGRCEGEIHAMRTRKDTKR